MSDEFPLGKTKRSGLTDRPGYCSTLRSRHVVLEQVLRLLILSLLQKRQEVVLIAGQAQENSDDRSVRPKKSVER